MFLIVIVIRHQALFSSFYIMYRLWPYIFYLLETLCILFNYKKRRWVVEVLQFHVVSLSMFKCLHLPYSQNMNSGNTLGNEIVARTGKGDDYDDTGIPDHGLGDNGAGGNDYEVYRVDGDY